MRLLGLLPKEVTARFRHVSSSLQSECNVAENKIQPKSPSYIRLSADLKLGGNNHRVSATPLLFVTLTLA